MNFCYGKSGPKRLPEMPVLSDYLDRATMWPPVPAQGWEFAVPKKALSILGNNEWSDCAEAGIMHLLQAQSYNAGRPLIPTTADTLNLYSAVTGFNLNAGPPGNNPTDQGTVLTDLLQYGQSEGITIGSTVHKLIGSASMDISSLAQMRWASYYFGGSYLGIQCPQKCETDTTNWNFGPGLPIAGGHCINRGGEGAAGGKIGSWGMWIPTSNLFFLSYLDEGYIVVTADWLDAQGEAPSGLDLNGLLTAMKQLG